MAVDGGGDKMVDTLSNNNSSPIDASSTIPNKRQKQFLNVPPPCVYETSYTSYYKDQWAKRRSALTSTSTTAASTTALLFGSSSSRHHHHRLGSANVEITYLEWYKGIDEAGGEGEDDPSSSSSSECYYLLGCTSTGNVVVWKYPKPMVVSAVYDDIDDSEHDDGTVRKLINTRRRRNSTSTHDDEKDAATNMVVNNTKPIVSLQVSKNPLTGIFPSPRRDDDLIVITGHDGILTLRFKEIITKSSSTTPNGRQSYDWWDDKQLVGSIDQATMYLDRIYTVSFYGDACKFDIETKKCVSKYKNPSSTNGSFLSLAATNSTTRNLHPVNRATIGLMRPMSNTAGNNPLLLVGSPTSGKILIWDVGNDQGMDSLDVGQAIASSSSPAADSFSSNISPSKMSKKSTFYGRSSSPTPPTVQHQPRITAMNLSEHWWTIAGGKSGGPYQSLEGGFIATFHGPSRSLVTCTTTRECIQHIASLSVIDEHANDSRLVTVANEGVVSYWDSTYSLQRTHRVWTSPQSSKSVAVLPWTNDGPNDTTVAVGGVGPTVDILQDCCKTQMLTL